MTRREHKGYVLELKPCRNDGTLGCFGTSCRDTFLMQTVLSIIRELFAETTFQILWHAMHAREISATRYSRDMHKKGQSKYHPSEAVGHSFSARSVREKRKITKTDEGKNKNYANLPLLTGREVRDADKRKILYDPNVTISRRNHGLPRSRCA